VTEEFLLRREMGCTAEEFVRWLPGAARHAPMQIENGAAAIQAAGGTIHVSFEQAPSRRLGLVAVPVLNVAFRFCGIAPAGREAFLAYFDLYTGRGGG
jgi:hypothetical protein